MGSTIAFDSFESDLLAFDKPTPRQKADFLDSIVRTHRCRFDGGSSPKGIRNGNERSVQLAVVTTCHYTIVQEAREPPETYFLPLSLSE